MDKENFGEMARKQFEFLVSKYNFNLAKCAKNDWGYELVYLSDKVGVKINYERRESYIFIMLYELVDGVFVDNPIFINKDTTLYGYGLDDIVDIRNPDALIKPAYEYDEESEYYIRDKDLSPYITAFAKNLKNYAKDVLNADFTIFSKIDKIIKERAKQ